MAKNISDIKNLEQKYGEMAYELCLITTGNPNDAEHLHHSLIRKWPQLLKLNQFKKYEQEWILHNISQNLLSHARKKKWLHHDKDSTPKDIPYRSDPHTNLENFEKIFPKLPLFEKLVLCLNLKYKIPLEKLAPAFGRNVDSIELAKSQALRRLSHWVSLESSNESVSTIEKRISALKCEKPKPIRSEKGKKQPARPNGWRTPWYVRYSLELVGAVSLILSIILLSPKIKRLNEYRPFLSGTGETLSYFNKIDSNDSNFDPKEILSGNSEHRNLASEEVDAFEGDMEEPSENEKEKPKKTEIRVGNSEIWRFYIKTESVSETRPRVVNTLAGLNLSDNKNMLTGREVPGGIQFSFLVPKSKVLTIKSQFEKLVSEKSLTTADTKSAFTWYKNKARGRQVVPRGQSRVIVWISQI